MKTALIHLAQSYRARIRYLPASNVRAEQVSIRAEFPNQEYMNDFLDHFGNDRRFSAVPFCNDLYYNTETGEHVHFVSLTF